MSEKSESEKCPGGDGSKRRERETEGRNFKTSMKVKLRPWKKNVRNDIDFAEREEGQVRGGGRELTVY